MNKNYDGLKPVFDKNGIGIAVGMEVAHIYTNGNYDTKGTVESDHYEGKIIKVTHKWDKQYGQWRSVERGWKHHFDREKIYEVLNCRQPSFKTMEEFKNTYKGINQTDGEFEMDKKYRFSHEKLMKDERINITTIHNSWVKQLKELDGAEVTLISIEEGQLNNLSIARVWCEEIV